jgi:outer membrane autotransporter protein
MKPRGQVNRQAELLALLAPDKSSLLAEQGRLTAFPTRPLEKSGVESLTLRHIWRPWTSFRLGWVFSSLGVRLRRKSRIAARIAGPVILLCALPGFASAQDATWLPTPSTPDFNTSANWTQATVPAGTATFNDSDTKTVTFSQDTTVGAMQFSAPDYTFELNAVHTLAINGAGILVDDPANAPTFNVSSPQLLFENTSTAGPAILNAFNTGPIAFEGHSTAGTAIITAGLAGSNAGNDPDGFTGGFVFFRGSSTAADAEITTHWASNIEFDDTSKAGNAKITAPVNGGSIFFANASSADHAIITMVDGTGELSFAPDFLGGGTATAGDATIMNNGRMNFFDRSTAGNATITNSGVTSFFNTSSADNAIITSSGAIDFHDGSTAGSATITTTTPFGVTNFHDTSNAGTATFTVGGEGVMNFFDQSSAQAASIHVDGTSSVNFHDGTTAGTAKLIAGDMGSTDDFTGGFIFFEGNSTADHSTITALGDSNIEFDDASHAGNATLVAGLPTRPIGADTNGFIFFTGTSSAENATITVNQFAELSFAPGFFGGGTATAGNANITNNGNTNFFQGSSAEHATITTNDGGVTSFFGRSTGGNATLITNAGGIVDISGLGTFPDTGNPFVVPPVPPDPPDPSVTGMTAGSIAGAGTYFLGSKQLTVGSNNLSTTVSGTIEDGGAAGGVGGSLVKVGTGTLTIDGAGTYTGGTTVSEGALVVGDFANPSAALSGGGPIFVGSGATLGGYGSVTGAVTNSGVIAPGSAAPGLSGSPMGAFTVNGNYTGAGGTMAINTVLGGSGSPSDRLVISGGAASGSTTVHVTNVGGVGAETTGNGIQVVGAVSGATTATSAFTLANSELRVSAFDYDLFRGGAGGASPNDWFLRSTFTGGGGGGGGGVPLPIPPFPIDPPPNPLPPGVAFPIIGPELATYGVVQPLARQLGLSILGTLDDRVGDTYQPDGCAVTPAAPPNALPTRKPGPALAPCPLFSPSVWGRFFGQTLDNRYAAFADPRASGNLGGFQGGIDLLRGSLIAGHYERAGLYGAYGDVNADVDGLVTNPAATAYVLTHTGSMNLNAWSAGGYWTHVGPGGWYLDAVLQGTWYYGSASTQFARLDTDGTGFIASLEGGYPFAWPQLGPGFVIEPQGQILWQKVSFRHDYDGLGDVALGDTTGPSGRIGLRTKWTIATAGGQVWQPYLRANLWRDWGAEANTVYSGTDIVPLLSQITLLEVGGGVTGRINANVSVFANVDYEFAVGAANGEKQNGVRGAFGARYTW